MAGPKGFFKSCALGCAGFTALLVVGGIVLSVVVWRSFNDDGKHPAGAPAGASATGGAMMVSEPMSDRAARLTTTRGGTVRLSLGEGEFYLRPAAPGEGLHARAEFDTTRHRLIERFAVLPDSTWEYHLECRQTGAGSKGFLNELFGGGKNSAKVRVYLPPEVPLDLVLRAQRGGCEADLGGLWLRHGEIDFRQGGIELEISSPLREPMESLSLRARMGGIAARHLGNASPRALTIDCGMGGGDIDLRGAWRGDCDARASVRMGGINLKVPAGMRIEGFGASGPTLTGERPEVPTPVLRLAVDQKMGEVEITR